MFEILNGRSTLSHDYKIYYMFAIPICISLNCDRDLQVRSAKIHYFITLKLMLKHALSARLHTCASSVGTPSQHKR